MRCLSDELVARAALGALAGDEREAATAHMGECAECRRLVSLVMEPAARTAGELVPGDRLGRYQLGDRLGSGAMGVVFQARDVELEREVAVKVLRDGGEERVRREAVMLARLAHPNVVTVFDVGVSDGTAYVAMELVAGQTLAGVARDEGEVLAMFAGLARGLAAAHRAGLVHRDIKPANILVDADGRARLGDFGLARAELEPLTHASAPPGSPLLSRSGALVGTPAYMAPEQLAGERASEQSDQFAFCVCLFEALHGRRPFEGDTIAELAAAIEAGPAAMRVSRPVEAVLRRGLAHAPGDRFP
ncbi:MAG TPA: serine/threonine-protein kinase, partial [Kofleriaceae bacterium]|nr:serine/threonine-protein kinase [Kofleriaceae bacterium]